MRPERAVPKQRWASALFAWDAQRRLRGTFARGLVMGLPTLRASLAAGPAIVALNHVSFWDGFVLGCLEQALGADAYCLMDRANLQRLSFLRFAGAVPVDGGDPKRARADLDRAARLLDRPARLLFVFPQGRQVPARLPLEFKSGVLRIAEQAQAPVVPVGLSYEFLEDPKPEIRLAVGAPLVLQNSVAGRRALERAVRDQLTRIDETLGAEGHARAGELLPLFAEKPGSLPAGSRSLGLLAARREA